MPALLAAAELLAMTLRFSASTGGPKLAAAWGLAGVQTAWLTNAVQLGFVVGALATAAIAAAVVSFLPAVGLRSLTGVTLVEIYPPGMKVINRPRNH